MTQPRLCIGVPVYNGASAGFAEMIESLLAQTFGDFEIFITDNCSTDETGEIGRRFAEQDKRVRYVKNDTNIGAYPNFNRAFEVANPQTYFKWAAHDDLYKPTFLEKCIEVLDREPDVVLAHTRVDVVDETEGHSLDQHPDYIHGKLSTEIDEHGRPVWLMGPLNLVESPDPVKRYDDFLNRMVACFQLFAVVRASALRGITMRPYLGSDRTLLGELALKGPFRQVPERLYINRYHKTVTRLRPIKEQNLWIGGMAKGLSPRRQQQIDLLRAPFEAKLTAAECWGCFAVASQHFARRETGRLVRTLFSSFPGLARPAILAAATIGLPGWF